MDRAQFMKQLERLLSDISEAERQEALAYYNSYFDEAGPENEASVTRELGSPGKVAAIIKADLNESSEEYAQYTEHGYEDLREKQDSYVPEVRENSSRAREGYHPKEKRSNSRLILILIALVFLSPFIVGAASGVFGILLVLILLPFLVIFVSGVVAFGLIVGACACIGTGVGLLFSNAAAGLLVMGIGAILMAFGILCCIFVGWLGSKQFFRSFQLCIKFAAKWLCFYFVHALLYGQFHRIILSGICKKTQSLIKKGTYKILLIFFIVKNRNIVRMSVLIQKKSINFYHFCYIFTKTLYPSDVFHLFNQISDAFPDICKFCKLHSQTFSCVLTK